MYKSLLPIDQFARSPNREHRDFSVLRFLLCVCGGDKLVCLSVRIRLETVVHQDLKAECVFAIVANLSELEINGQIRVRGVVLEVDSGDFEFTDWPSVNGGTETFYAVTHLRFKSQKHLFVVCVILEGVVCTPINPGRRCGFRQTHRK